jgi:hypothetical protein
MHLTTGEQRDELIGRGGLDHAGPVEPFHTHNPRTGDLHSQAIGSKLNFG